MTRRSSAVNGMGKRRSLGGCPEPMWPPAFALRGPCDVFSARAEAPSRSVRVSSWRAGIVQSCRLIPLPTEAHDGRRVSGPSGLRGFSPANSPASPQPGFHNPSLQPERGPQSSTMRSDDRTTGRPPLRSRPAARPGPGPRTPSPHDGTRSSLGQPDMRASINRLNEHGRWIPWRNPGEFG